MRSIRLTPPFQHLSSEPSDKTVRIVRIMGLSDVSDASDASDGKYSNILFYFKNGTEKGIRENLDFILDHFISNSFPRTISTKTTEGRQILVNNKDEAQLDSNRQIIWTVG